MKLKHTYSLSVIGILLAGFGCGWITLSQILSLPLTNLTIIGATAAVVGLAIMISTLSTIRKIEIEVEDV